MAFGNRNNGGSNGPLPPRQNVAFQVTGYNVKDPKNTNLEDTFTATLMAEAFGQPVGTEMTFRQAKLNNSQSVQSMKHGSKPMVAPTVVGGQGVAEGAYIDRRTGHVVVNWLSPKVRNPNDETVVQQLLVGQLFSVDSERTNPDTKFASQNAFMYDRENAVRITEVSEAALLEAIGNHLLAEGGTPGFVLRGVDLDKFSEGAFSGTRFTLPRVESSQGVYRDATPEEAIAKFLASDACKTFVSELLDPNDPVVNPLIELIPTLRFRVGAKSLPSTGVKDQSRFFKIPRENSEYFDHFIAQGHMHIQWSDPKKEGEKGSYFATYVVPAQRAAPMFHQAQILTPNLPDEVAKHFVTLAEATGKRIDKYLSPEQSASTTPEQADEPAAGGPRP